MDKKKRIGLIVGIILFVATIGGLTYAYVTWTSQNMNKQVSSKCFNVLYDKGADIIGAITPSYDYTGGLSNIIKMNMSSKCNVQARGILYLNTSSETSENLFREGLLNYHVIRNGNQVVASGNITKSGRIAIDLGPLAHSETAFTRYEVYVWLDYNLIENTDVNSVYYGNIRATAVQYEGDSFDDSVRLIDHITNLYLTNKDKKVTNNSIEYQYATSVNLMNDRLGGTTSNYDDGNIRYYGASPDNYVYFNCDDYSNQNDDTCEKWRIIGIVDGKVKIIREEALGYYAWDNTSTGEYDNNWHDSTSQVLLNNGFYNNLDGIIYYNIGPSQTYTINFKTDKNGIKNAKTRGLISESTWYLGGYDDMGIYPNDIYVYERGTSIGSNTSRTWTGKIGLIYSSDYGYAADLSVCKQTLDSYNNTNCKGTNWLNSYNQWLITPYSSRTDYAWSVSNSGIPGVFEVFEDLGIRAVLYLDSEVFVYEGNGTSGRPYKLSDTAISNGSGNISDRVNIIEHITNLYVNNNPKQITQGGSNAKYYYSSGAKLMNDGFDSAGNYITDTTALTNGTSGNIRYYGANPDNYIYFNCDDYSDQTAKTCELWRIIGIVDGKVKIMRNESLGNYSWDYPLDDTSSDWYVSNINGILNGGYYNNEDEITYNNNGTEITINFKSDNKGLKNDTTRSLISESIWYLGGSDSKNNTSRIYPNDRYIAERGTGKCTTCTFDTTWTGNIGLMYASDYGYAGDLTQCGVQFYEYYLGANSVCKTTNWMFSSTSNKWTISPYSAQYAWSSRTNGQMALDKKANELYGVHPTVYLDASLDVGIEGYGTIDIPYQIVVD